MASILDILFGRRKQQAAEAPKNEPKNEQPKNEQPEADADFKRIYHLMILDASGSMNSIRRQALSGLNETIQTCRESQNEHPEQRHYISLVSFNSSHTKVIYDLKPVDKAEELTERQYRPNGGTPLYDTMGYSLSRLRKQVREDDVVLVTIITDGEENCSVEYSGRSISALVEELSDKGWIFAYIGANQNVMAVAAKMSIHNTMAFESTEAGTSAMFERERESRRMFASRLAAGESKSDIAKSFFHPDR